MVECQSSKLIMRVRFPLPAPFLYNMSDIHKLKSVGKFTYGHDRIMIKSYGSDQHCTIGSFCSISENCTILLGGEHRTDFISTYPFGYKNRELISGSFDLSCTKNKGNVIIGNDVWIGYNVTIMSGVKVGNGSVIGANSLVTKDVSPYSIVAGNPAKFLKYRFDEEVIKKLMIYEWWNLPNEKIQSLVPLLLSSNIELFLTKLEELKTSKG